MEQERPGAGQAQHVGRPPPVYDPNNGGHFGMLLRFQLQCLG